MSEIFISYARSTAAQAKAVTDALRALGYDIWRDDQLPAHRSYSDVIDERLRSAKAVVVIWSTEAVRSQWVRAEADVARQSNTLVQLSIDGALPPLPFNQIQCADMNGWSGDTNAPGWRKVVASVAELVGGPAAAKPTPTRNSDLPVLAVLAFDNLSADTELQFFSDGISEEILNLMTRVSGIRVVGPTSSFSFRGSQKKSAARELKATHVLDGSVRRGGARVRIAAHLAEASSGLVLWSENYDREVVDTFAVQDEIAALAAKALVATLAPSSPRRQLDPQAYDLYLRALTVRRAPDRDAQRKAIAYLEAALAIEPNFARGRAALAFTLGQTIADATLEGSRVEAFDEAVAAVRLEAQRALELNPGEAEAQLSLLFLEPSIGQWRSREESIDAASQASPGDLGILLHRARWLIGVGRVREAYALQVLGYESDPLSPFSMVYKAQALWALERDAERAGSLYERALSLAPAEPYIWRRRYIFLVLSEQWAEAHRMLDGSRQVPLGVTRERLNLYALWIEAMKLRTDAVREDYRAAAIAGVRRWSFTVIHAVLTIAAIGLVDAAFDLFEEAMATQPPGHLWSPWNAEAAHGGGTDIFFRPWLKGVRDSPRFLPLCGRLGLCSYWAETGHWPDFIVDAPNRSALEDHARRLSR